MIVVLSTSDSENSRGARCASDIAARLAKETTREIRVVDWGHDPAAASATLANQYEQITAVVMVAPVRNFGIAAPSKAAIEQLPDLFRERPVGIVMTAGTPRSLLAVQGLIIPLILDYQSVIYPKVVHLPGEPDEAERIETFAREFARFCERFAPASAAE